MKVPGPKTPVTNAFIAKVLIAGLAAAMAIEAVAQRAPSPPDNTGPNAAIERVIRGAYVTREAGNIQGGERFELITHPGGTRTLIAWSEAGAAGVQLHAVVRVDERFRPIETHHQYWVDGKFKGTAYFRLDETRLEGRVRTPQASFATQTLGTEGPVSFATHSVAADGWRTAYVDAKRGGEQRGTLVSFDASKDLSVPIVVGLQPQLWRYGGKESVAVPAGRFDSERYESADATIWVTGADRVLVRAVWPATGREHVLAQYETLPDSAGGGAVDPTAAPIERASTGANPNIQRWIEGEYAYRALDDGRDRGWERFRLTVHPDGSRSMLMWHGLRARSAQFTVALRTEASFRPLDAYVSYWNDGKFKGSGAMRVMADTLDLTSHGAWGLFQENTTVPAGFSIGTHPIAADGWHLLIDAKGGVRAEVYGLEAGTDPAKPIRGVTREMPVQKIGDERISVPAGEFDTTHYRLAGSTDIWIHGEDRLMVRMRAGRSNRDYVLTRYSTGR